MVHFMCQLNWAKGVRGPVNRHFGVPCELSRAEVSAGEKPPHQHRWAWASPVGARTEPEGGGEKGNFLSWLELGHPSFPTWA